MYKTDKQRAAEGRPSYYTAPELDAACAAYFEDCDAKRGGPTPAPPPPGTGVAENRGCLSRKGIGVSPLSPNASKALHRGFAKR